MTHVRLEKSDYSLSTDPADLDVAAIHAFLTSSYWARGIPREILERAIASSLPCGIRRDDAQVGFARAVTDRATFAYLMDVYVLEEHRGRGLGRWMVGALLALPELQGLRKLLLATRDAHPFYAGLGFRPLARPEMLMEIADPDVYRPGDVE